MNTLKVSVIAFPDAQETILKRGEDVLKSKLNDINISIVNENPDAVFIVTGGSEKQAASLLNSKKQILILAISSDNSYAAATEIKSYCNQHSIVSILYNLDHEPDIQQKVKLYLKSIQALNILANFKIGLIGNVSEWLINSTIDNNLLKTKLGIEIEQIAWNNYPEYVDFSSNQEFIEHFKKSDITLEDSSRVYNLLQHIKDDQKLDAITVECFPLVRNHAVTACLALSKMNTDGFPAGCEGDITSITGKVIVKALTGEIPWMANMAAIEKESIFLAHCTIATNLVEDFNITTHFETNLGTAVQGRFKAREVTIFRMNNQLNKAFISSGKIIELPEKDDACRTQIKVQIPNEDTQKLKDNPLGNHHLVIPGNHTVLIKYFCSLVKIDVI